LTGSVKHYAWGGYDVIPGLLRVPNVDRQPFAELWFGVHPAGSSHVRINGHALPLDELIARAPREILGLDAASRFADRLPYLLKLLDVRQALSIQVHPTRDQAAAGFQREGAADPPLAAEDRSYPDANAKPEVHVALTDFWMLHGFRPVSELTVVLRNVPAFSGFEDSVRWGDGAGDAAIRRLYTRIMTIPQPEVNARLEPLVSGLRRSPPTDKSHPDYWVWRTACQSPKRHGYDRGLFSIYLLNLVHLSPGAGTYQPPGLLHAYLEGVTIELMANSDNVLRGGLTSKPTNVAEVLRVADFAPGHPSVLVGRSESSAEMVYDTPAQELRLSRIELVPGKEYQSAPDRSVDMLLAVEGAAQLSSAGEVHDLDRGDAVLAPAAVDYCIRSRSPRVVLFRATVPVS
jgi:mannose-6-phosphate isomerase